MKRRITVIIMLLLVCSFFCVSCAKENRQITVYGTVFHNSSPVQGADVSVEIYDPYQGGSAYYSVGQTVSGSDGSYEVTFTIDDEDNQTGSVNGHYYYNSTYGWSWVDDVRFTIQYSDRIKIDLNLK